MNILLQQKYLKEVVIPAAIEALRNHPFFGQEYKEDYAKLFNTPPK